MKKLFIIPKIEGMRINLEPLNEKMDVPNELLEFSKSDSISSIHYVVYSKTNDIIGIINIDKIKEIRDTYNVSYMILEKYRGNKYTKEALIFLFENLYINKSVVKLRNGKAFQPTNLVIVSSIHNDASKCIAADLGFSFINRIKIQGKSHNVYLLSKYEYYENQLDYTLMKLDFIK